MLESQPGGCGWRNHDMWGHGFWWWSWRPKGFPATVVIQPLLPQHLCHSISGNGDTPGLSPGSAVALLQQNSILPALLRCPEMTCIMRIAQDYGCLGQFEITQTYIFISSSEQWQHQHWQKEVKKVSCCSRRNKPGLAETCRQRSNNFLWNHARELEIFLCQNNTESKWRRIVAGSFWELSQTKPRPTS